MAANPYIVSKDIPAGTFTYDGVPNNVIARGTVIDVPNGSALATALSGYITAVAAAYQNSNMAASYGASNLENVVGGGNLPSAYAGQ